MHDGEIIKSLERFTRNFGNWIQVRHIWILPPERARPRATPLAFLRRHTVEPDICIEGPQNGGVASACAAFMANSQGSTPNWCSLKRFRVLEKTRMQLPRQVSNPWKGL